MIPTRRMCEHLWDDLGIPDGTRKHMAAVCDLSVKIGKALNQNGYPLDISLIEAAALLHDIKKGVPHHAAAGAQMLEALGYTEIAPLVKAHMRLSDRSSTEITQLTVVFLADKLLIGSKLVCLEERYGEKLLAYQEQPEVIPKIQNQLALASDLEKRIKTILGVKSLFLLP